MGDRSSQSFVELLAMHTRLVFESLLSYRQAAFKDRLSMGLTTKRIRIRSRQLDLQRMVAVRQRISLVGCRPEQDLKPLPIAAVARSGSHGSRKRKRIK